MSHLVSVCIPNYNHAEYLPECLDAIFSQSYTPHEVIVIDDASKDHSIEILQQYQSRFQCLKVVRHQQNQGVHATEEELVQLAKGDLISICAADDLLLPGCLERSVDVLSRHPEVMMTFGNISFFNSRKPYQFELHRFLNLSSTLILDPDQFVNICRESRLYIPSTTCMYRKKAFDDVDGHRSQNLSSWCDFFLNCQIAFRNKVAYIPQNLGAFRLNPKSYGALAGSSFAKRRKMYLEVLKKAEKEGASFQKKLRRSGLLWLGGYSMILTLFFEPKYWGYLPLLVRKKLPDLPQLIWKWTKMVILYPFQLKGAQSKPI